MNSYKKATWNLNVLYTYISTYFHSKKLFCFDSDLKVLARSWWFAEKLDTYLAKKTNKQNVQGLFGESVFEYNDA